VRLRELVADRLRDLEPPERRALGLLAVGEPLSAGMIEELVPGALNALERRGLIVEQADGQRSSVRLVHPAYAETLRAEMSPRAAKELRGDLVRAFVTTGTRRRDDSLRVASWHLESGAEPDVALLYAGYETALNATHFELALRFIQRVLEADPSPAYAWRCLHALHFLGRLDDAIPLVEAYRGSEGPDEDRANLALCSSVVLRDMGHADEAIDLLRRAHAELARGEWADRVLGHIAEQLWLACRYDEALDVTLPTVDAPNFHPFARAYTVSVAALVLATTGRSTDALEMLERVTPTIEPTTTSAISTLLHGQLRALALDGRLDEALAHTGDVHRWALEHGNEVSRQGGAVGLAAFHLVAGRPRTALEYARESNAIMRTMNPTQSYYVGYEAEALALLGDGEAAMQAWKQAPRFREPEHPESVRQRAWIAAAQGDVQEARRLTTEAADASAAMGALNTELSALLDAVRLGAVGLIARLAAVCEQCQGSHAAAARRYAEGLRRDDPDELSSASQALEAVGRVLCAAEASAQAAISYARRGLKARAASAAARSATLADRCEGARTPILQAGPSPDPLTPRERDVVDLAREGLTSREIAERLVVSVRTVETYLQRAYAKLGVSGRHELASAALERGSS
jgi:ATP/maltotriose-dependent transcriptional regulator MalT